MYGEIYNAEWEEKRDCELLHIDDKRPRICSAAYVKRIYKGMLHSTQHLAEPDTPQSAENPYYDNKVVIHSILLPVSRRISTQSNKATVP